MVVAAATVSVLLAAVLAFSAIRKLSHQERVVQSYVRAGVPEDKLDYLAIILLAGAAGLCLGLFWAPIGVAAGIGVTCYFIVAVAFHVRADDAEHLPTPLVIALTAAAALILRLETM
jgi:DoxX-like family